MPKYSIDFAIEVEAPTPRAAYDSIVKWLEREENPFTGYTSCPNSNDSWAMNVDTGEEEEFDLWDEESDDD